MTSPLPPSLPPALDVLGAPDPEPRRRGRMVLAGVAAAAALGVAGAAVAVGSWLGGGGAQPEDVLPASAFGMVKLDLDPAAGQKLAVYRLAKRFPSTSEDVDGQDDVRDALLSALLSQGDDVDYERDVRPWVGDRVGLAVVPGDGEPEPLAAIAVTDRGAAERSLPRLLDGQDAAFAFSQEHDYVLVGSSQATVDAAAAGTDVLAGNRSWKDGVAALDGDQVVTGWLDLGALADALPEQARQEAARAYGLEELAVEGTVVLGAHAGDDHVEVVGRTLDVEGPFAEAASLGSGAGTGLLAGLPDDTVAALSVTGLGAGLADLFATAYGEDDPLGLVAGAAGLGVDLPEDLRVLLGEETVAAALGEQDVALRTRTSDAGAAVAAWTRLTSAAGGGGIGQVQQVEGGVVVGSNPQAVRRMAAGGDLGGAAAFRRAVPDAQDAGMVLYVDVARALALSGADLGEDARDVEPLEALGVTSSGDARSSTFRVRLTLRD